MDIGDAPAVVDGIDDDVLGAQIADVEQGVVAETRPLTGLSPIMYAPCTSLVPVMTSEMESLSGVDDKDFAAVGFERHLHRTAADIHERFQTIGSRRCGAGAGLCSCGLAGCASAIAMTWWPAEQVTKAFDESGRMTTSEAPGQPAKTARTLRLAGSMRLTEFPLRLATARVFAVRRKAHRNRLLAGSDLGGLAAAFQIDDGDRVGAGVGDVGKLACGIDVDGDRLAMQRNGGDDSVVFGVDDGERALASPERRN